MIDQHLHTKFSPDSNTEIEEYLEVLPKYGNDYLVITDHFDILKHIKKSPGHDYREQYLLLEEYVKQYDNVKLGIEVGYNKVLLDEINQKLSSYKYNSIILSIHDSDLNDIRYCVASSYDLDIKTIVDMYFDEMYEAVHSSIDYDILAHVGYIFRYTKNQVNPQDYIQTIKPILKRIILDNKILEVNSSCLAKPTVGIKEFYAEMLKVYYEMGGRNISFGSDAHNAKDYCRDFESLIPFVTELGFDSIIEVNERTYDRVSIV